MAGYVTSAGNVTFIPVPAKTLEYLGGKTKRTSRLIVAGKYLKDGRIAFIDRKNSLLLITNTEDESMQEVDLILPLFEQDRQRGNDVSSKGASVDRPEGFYREQPDVKNLKSDSSSREEYVLASGSEKGKPELFKKMKYSPQEDVKPSDVNYGFNDDQLLITYTGKDFSLGVVYQVRFEERETILQHVLKVKVMDRTRSVVVLDKDHLCATTPNKIVVLYKSGDCIALQGRSIRDRGGLLMSDGSGRVFYGDGDEFVCCQWNGRYINEVFRFSHSRMKFPRGSAIDRSGHIVVCCDSSNNIFRISSSGKEPEIVVADGRKSFGDVDFHPNGECFITTFWEENEWPILYKARA